VGGSARVPLVVVTKLGSYDNDNVQIVAHSFAAALHHARTIATAPQY